MNTDFNILNTFNIEDWKQDEHGMDALQLREMGGRQVGVVPLAFNESIKCPDCGKLAAFIILEKDMKVWFYCGICDIGG